MDHPLRIGVARWLLAACWCAAPLLSAADAAEWSAEPTMSVKGEYSDNLTITPQPHSDVYGHWISPAATFKGSTERFELGGGVAADFVHYYGAQPRSLTNVNVPIMSRYKTDRDAFGLDGAVTRDNTLMGELLQTGLVLSFTQRNLYTVNPTWTRSLGERASLQTGYQYSDVTYEDGARLGLVDYRTHAGNASLTYKLTERDHAELAGYYVQFLAPAVALQSDFYGGQATLKHDFTERLSVSLSGGARNIVSTTSSPSGGTLRDQEWVWLYTADVLQRFERGTAGATCSRTINPSGFGLLIRTQLCGVTFTIQATERLTVSLAGQVYWVEPISTQGSVPTFPNNRYFRIQPGLRWRVTPDWLLMLNYSYAQRDIAALDQRATANGAIVTLTYVFPKLSVSR